MSSQYMFLAAFVAFSVNRFGLGKSSTTSVVSAALAELYLAFSELDLYITTDASSLVMRALIHLGTQHLVDIVLAFVDIVLAFIAPYIDSLLFPKLSNNAQPSLGTLHPILCSRAEHPETAGPEAICAILHPDLTNTERLLLSRIQSLEDKATSSDYVVTFLPHQPTIERVEGLERALKIVSDRVDVLGQPDKVRADCEELKDMYVRMLNGEFPHGGK